MMITLSSIQGLSQFTKYYGYILGILFLVHYARHRLKVATEVWFYLMWLLWSASGKYIAVDMDSYNEAFKDAANMGVVYFILSGIYASKPRIGPAFLAVALGVLTMCLISLYSGEMQSIRETDQFSYLRLKGITGNANSYSFYMLYGFIFVAYLWEIKQYWWVRAVCVVASMCLIIMISYTASRKIFVGFLLFVTMWWYLCYAKGMGRKPIKTLLMMLIVTVGLFFATNYIFNKTYLGVRLKANKNSDDVGGDALRKELYIRSMQIFLQSPICGVGLDNFKAHNRYGFYSHSEYMEILTDTGIVGFVLYFSFYFILFRRFGRLEKLTQHHQIIYVVRLSKAFFLTLLFINFFIPQMGLRITWVFLASVSGYTWGVERSLLINRAMSKVQPQ